MTTALFAGRKFSDQFIQAAMSENKEYVGAAFALRVVMQKEFF